MSKSSRHGWLPLCFTACRFQSRHKQHVLLHCRSSCFPHPRLSPSHLPWHEPSGRKNTNFHLTLFHSKEWWISTLLCSLITTNITCTSDGMQNLVCHILHRWKTIILTILTTSLKHFSLRGWVNVQQITESRSDWPTWSSLGRCLFQNLGCETA